MGYNDVEKGQNILMMIFKEKKLNGKLNFLLGYY